VALGRMFLRGLYFVTWLKGESVLCFSRIFKSKRIKSPSLGSVEEEEEQLECGYGEMEYETWDEGSLISEKRLFLLVKETQRFVAVYNIPRNETSSGLTLFFQCLKIQHEGRPTVLFEILRDAYLLKRQWGISKKAFIFYGTSKRFFLLYGCRIISITLRT